MTVEVSVRTCRFCKNTDEPHPLNGRVKPFVRADLCAACCKQRSRRSCSCGAPFYVIPFAPNFITGCISRCGQR